MTREAVDRIFDACEQQGWDVQITYQRREYTAHFVHTSHRDWIKMELTLDGHPLSVPEHDRFDLGLV